MARGATTVGTLKCESPYVSHVPHFEDLVDVGLGWASLGNSFHSFTSTPFNSTVFLWLRDKENETERVNLQASKSSEFFRTHRIPHLQYLHEEYQFLRDQSLQGMTKVFTRRHTFVGVNILRITQIPQRLIEPMHSYKLISLLTYKSSIHQNN